RRQVTLCCIAREARGCAPVAVENHGLARVRGEALLPAHLRAKQLLGLDPRDLEAALDEGQLQHLPGGELTAPLVVARLQLVDAPAVLDREREGEQSAVEAQGREV